MSTFLQAKFRFERQSQSIIQLHQQVRTIITKFCDSTGYNFASRVKSIESITGKMESGRYARWSELDDLIAFSIIIPDQTHEEAVRVFINDKFRIEHSKPRGSSNKSSDTFRFDLTRLYVTYKKFPTVIEFQIRTAFEHAWCYAFHGISYKPDDFDWRRQRLAATIKAAVELIDTVLITNREIFQAIQEPAQDINSQRIFAELKKNFAHVEKGSSNLPYGLSQVAESINSIVEAKKSTNWFKEYKKTIPRSERSQVASHYFSI